MCAGFRQQKYLFACAPPKLYTRGTKYIQGHAAFSSSRIAGLKQSREVVWRRRSNEARLRMGSHSATRAVLKACTKLSSSSFITSAAPASSRFQISQDQNQMNTKAWSIWSFCPSLPRTASRRSGPFLDFPPPLSGFLSTVSNAANCRSLPSICPSKLPTQLHSSKREDNRISSNFARLQIQSRTSVADPIRAEGREPRK